MIVHSCDWCKKIVDNVHMKDIRVERTEEICEDCLIEFEKHYKEAKKQVQLRLKRTEEGK